MEKQKNVNLVRKENIVYILRDSEQRISEWQYKSTFTTERALLQQQGRLSIEDYTDRVNEHIKEKEYIKAAKLAERCGDHTLKIRSCMDGIRYYSDMLKSMDGKTYSEKRIFFEDVSAAHGVMAELYEIFGDRKRSDYHLDMCISAENGIFTEGY